MSAEPIDVPPAQDPAIADMDRQSRKSYRRKYRKMMVYFEKVMSESTGLFKEEQRMMDIAQRIAEQNDMLLELLVELNTCPQVPARLRYDLTPPHTQPEKYEQFEEILKEVVDEESGHLALRKARHQVRMGQITQAEYSSISEAIANSKLFRPENAYANLLATRLIPPTPPEDKEELPINMGYLTVKQEEQYRQALDEFLEGKSSNPRTHAIANLGNPHDAKALQKEREMHLRNPNSAYNWLRKHQPQVFLQDHDEKPKASSRSSKRATAQKHEADSIDEYGLPPEEPSSLRNKRKRDEDPGYRPKGGSSRPSKRKRDQDGSGPTPSAKRKKPSGD